MSENKRGGWVYIMADRYRGTMYVGVTANLAQRIFQHRQQAGSDFCVRYGLSRLVWAEVGETIQDCIAHEKRLKRWRREWKFALIERAIRIGLIFSTWSSDRGRERARDP